MATLLLGEPSASMDLCGIGNIARQILLAKLWCSNGSITHGLTHPSRARPWQLAQWVDDLKG